MKTKSVLLALLALSGIGLSSCKNGQEISLPPCTGKPGEILIIMADDLYKGAAGDTLVGFLTQEEPALPGTGMEGAEAMFNVLHLPPSALNNTLRPARNLLIVDVGSQYTKPEIAVFRDYWAADQLLMRINAPDRDQLVKLVTDSRMDILNIMRNGEVDRLVSYNRKYKNQDLSDKILREHDIDVSLPKGFEIKVDTGNFLWVQFDPAEVTQGVLFWSYPYTSEKQLELAELQAFTDDFLRPRLPGPSAPAKVSYMRIVPDVKVMSHTFTMNGNFVREMKGLWEVKVDFMGGPFISWTMVDEKRNRIVTAFGFVFAPKVDKRNQVRKIESKIVLPFFPEIINIVFLKTLHPFYHAKAGSKDNFIFKSLCFVNS